MTHFYFSLFIILSSMSMMYSAEIEMKPLPWYKRLGITVPHKEQYIISWANRSIVRKKIRNRYEKRRKKNYIARLNKLFDIHDCQAPAVYLSAEKKYENEGSLLTVNNITPLNKSLLAHDRAMIHLLLETVRFEDYNQIDALGNTCVHYAAQAMADSPALHPAYIHYLLNKGADPSIKNKNGVSALMMAEQIAKNNTGSKADSAWRKHVYDLMSHPGKTR